MNRQNTQTFKELIKGNPYPGRGIVTGFTNNVDKAVFAYFIMGRSESSRNRVFTYKNGEIFTTPLDENKVEDPSLIIYQAVKYIDNQVIITNGDHTLTIADALSNGMSLCSVLATRTFEPDPPNFTSRISAVMNLSTSKPSYTLSILKHNISITPQNYDDDKNTNKGCNRFFFNYEATAEVGHLIHTYERNAHPLPPFSGEPKELAIPKSIDSFRDEIWESLDQDNKISLFVTYIDLKTKEKEYRLINKYSK